MSTTHQSETGTSIALVQSTLAEFDRVQAGIGALAQQYGNVAFDCATTKGMDGAKAARLAIREPRYAVDRAAKAAKAPLNDIKRNIDERAQQITAALLEIEAPIDEQIKAAEEAKRLAREAAATAERQRVELIAERLAGIRAAGNLLAGTSPADVLIAVQTLDAFEPTAAEFAEFLPAAIKARADVLAALNQTHAAAVAHEAELLRMQAEREELARQRAAQAEEARVERARLKAEAEALAEARAIEQRAQAAAQAEQQRILSAQRAEAQAVIDEAARIASAARAEQDRIAAEARRTDAAIAAAEAALAAPGQEPVAYYTTDAEGTPSMLWLPADLTDARRYCDDGDEPVPLYAAAPAQHHAEAAPARAEPTDEQIDALINNRHAEQEDNDDFDELRMFANADIRHIARAVLALREMGAA